MRAVLRARCCSGPALMLLLLAPAHCYQPRLRGVARGVTARRAPLRASHPTLFEAEERPGDAVLRFRDAASSTQVILVGTMHYNPVSCALVKRTVTRAAEEQGLRTVMLELCPARWNSTRADELVDPSIEVELARRLKRVLFEDEFQASFEAARACGVGVELAD